jgi:hypothetical protein
VAIGPAHILAVLVGLFHTALYVFLRGYVSPRILLTAIAAVLGAWAGDAVGGRLGIDPLRIGDFHLISASLVAWFGIVFVAVLAVLGPELARDDR